MNYQKQRENNNIIRTTIKRINGLNKDRRLGKCNFPLHPNGWEARTHS